MPAMSAPAVAEEHIDEEEDSLAKESCHDSGIDIRESSLPPIVPIPTKKVSQFSAFWIYLHLLSTFIVAQQYSDADIVLSKEWVPPITIAPTNVSMGSDSESPARKKTNSVSFSLDSSSDADIGIPPLLTGNSESKEDIEKADSRKNKVRNDHFVSSLSLSVLVYRKDHDNIFFFLDVKKTVLSSVMDGNSRWWKRRR